MIDTNILRLFISQIFTIYLALLLIPLKHPTKRHLYIVIIGSLIITIVNALLIFYFGIAFYVQYYILTLTIPHVILFYMFSYYKGSKLFFALLSTQIIGNFAVINGLLSSYLIYKENTPMIDALGRLITYIPLIYVTTKYIRPSYLKMANTLKHGWWILNMAMVCSYALLYFILFVPSPIFDRPIYFIHGYIGVLLSLVIYIIIYFLFEVIDSRHKIEIDKNMLSMKVTTLSKETENMLTLAHSDSLTGLKNRYALYKDLDRLILQQTPFLLVFMDLNQLKKINDEYSHIKGDMYLKNFADAISYLTGEDGIPYRFAGDEFLCILTQNIENFNMNKFKLEVSKRMDESLPFLGFSVGISNYPEDGTLVDQLINIADKEMYKDKKDQQS